MRTMKAAEMKPFRQSLEAIRARLRGDVNTMADAALRKNRAEASGDLSTMPIHMADLGSDAYEQEFTLSLMRRRKTPSNWSKPRSSGSGRRPTGSVRSAGA